MTVDVVAEERRRLFGHQAQPSVGQQTRLDQRLETVADTQNQTAPVEQTMYFLRNILVVQHIGNEFTAAVRLVARREAAAEHEDMARSDRLLHPADRIENSLRRQVAEHLAAHFGTRPAEGLRGVVVAVAAREYGDENHRTLDRLARIGEAAESRHRLHDRRMVDSLIGINRRKAFGIGPVKLFERHFFAVDRERFLRLGMSQQLGGREIERLGALHHDRTVRVVEQRSLIHLDIGTDAVAERHLGQRFRHTAEADGIARNDLAGLDSRTYEIEIPLQRPGIGHMVFERGMTH